jgi:hypothetical protein
MIRRQLESEHVKMLDFTLAKVWPKKQGSNKKIMKLGLFGG